MFANNLTLCRLILRRDRISIFLWFAGIMLLVVGFGSMLPGMYPSEAERLVMGETMKSPAMVSMLGPVYSEGGYTVGALYSNFMLLWSAMILAVMNIFLVIRHTRKDEERGRNEVVRSLPVGRLSNLSATLTMAFIENALLALCMGVGLSLMGESSMGMEGSMLFGASVGAVGLLFAAVTAIFCQLCASPRTAQGLSFAFFGLMFMLRAAGDMQNETLACLSPLGLILRTKPYTENVWWPVFVTLGVTLTLTLVAFALCARRDLGEGLIPARPGRRDAARSLSGAGGLAWRLLRSSFLIWTAVVLVLGMAYGSVMGDLESFIETNEVFRQILTSMGGKSLTEQFVGFLMVIMAIVNTIPVLSFMLKARTQERRGYAENILVRSVSRQNQLGAYVLISCAASLLMPLMTAVGFWCMGEAVMKDPLPFTTYLQAAAAFIPALWFMIGVAAALIAFLPRLTALVWALLGYSLFVSYIGSMLKLPEWAEKLSPYGYIPTLGAENASYTGAIMLAGLAALLVCAGFAGYHRRDMKLA